MPFRFSLATVLQIRESLEKREERALQKIQLEMARVLHQIEELNAEIAKSHKMREQEMAQPIPASHLHMLLWQVQAAGEKRGMLFQNLLALEQQRDLYEQEQARGEQKSLDDIFMARRHRS